MNSVLNHNISNELPVSRETTGNARAVTRVGSEYAARNRIGTIGDVLHENNNPVTVNNALCGSRLRTEAAHEIANRYKYGTVCNLLS